MDKKKKLAILKFIHILEKEIKDADEITLEVNKGIFDLPSEKGQMEHCYDGSMDISIHVYSKKNDGRPEFLKQRWNKR